MRDLVVGCVVSLCVLVLGLVPGCECAGPSISVDLLTDLVPVRQFVRIETTLGAATTGDAQGMDAGAAPLRQTAHNVGTDESYLHGVRVAELGTLARGDYRLRVNVLDSSANVVASRRVDVTVTGHTAITVTITRSCIGVSCPPSTDPTLTECVDDQCVDPRCSASTPRFCGTPACTQDTDCHADGCGHATCASGSCLVAPDDTLCSADQICWVDFTCIPRPPDGDAGATPDFGSDLDADAWAPDPDAWTADDVSTATDDDAYIIPELDAAACIPGADCAALGYECGDVVDACGVAHMCGACGTGLGCNAYHRCQSACIPAAYDTTNGGGLCGDLNEAYTARGINVGYYPFHVRSSIPMYSGDFDGAPGTTFTRGPTHGGVVLQVIRPGAYVGLSSTGPWYDPPSATARCHLRCAHRRAATCGATRTRAAATCRGGFPRTGGASCSRASITTILARAARRASTSRCRARAACGRRVTAASRAVLRRIRAAKEATTAGARSAARWPAGRSRRARGSSPS